MPLGPLPPLTQAPTNSQPSTAWTSSPNSNNAEEDELGDSPITEEQLLADDPSQSSRSQTNMNENIWGEDALSCQVDLLNKTLEGADTSDLDDIGARVQGRHF